MTIKTQRRIPAAMTKFPPEKRMKSSSFSRQGSRALKSIYGCETDGSIYMETNVPVWEW